MKKLVADDWQKAEYSGVGKKEFVTFDFDFSDCEIEPNLLPVQYEASNNLLDMKFEVAPRTNFIDLDLHDYSLLGRNEVEAMKYTCKRRDYAHILNELSSSN